MRTGCEDSEEHDGYWGDDGTGGYSILNGRRRASKSVGTCFDPGFLLVPPRSRFKTSSLKQSQVDTERVLQRESN